MPPTWCGRMATACAANAASGKQDWTARGRTNVIGALIGSGTGSALLTVTLFSANIDSDVFHAWTTHDLISRHPDAAVIVIDTTAFHKRADTKAAVEKAGHKLEYLPPYALDPNRINHKWAQARAIRRKTGKRTEQIFESELVRPEQLLSG